MKRHSTALQIGVVVAAVAFGILLDRFVLGGGRSPRLDGRPDSGAGSAAAPSGATADAPDAPPASSHATGSETAPRQQGASPAASLDSILAGKDQRQRLRELQEFISNVSPTGYPDALRRIRQITSSNERELASRLLVAHWALSDPDGALQFAAGNRGFEYVAEDVFQQLAASDFDAAMSRASGIPGNELRYRALRGILSVKADTDPRGALELAKTLGEFRGTEPLANVVYRQWAAVDPEAAAAAAAEGGQEGGWRSPVAPVVDTWANQDPVAAANWSLSLPDGEAQARSVGQVMRRWTREDPNGAANWIHSLEQGRQRDAAVAGFAQALVASDPPLAIGWINTISDEGMRMRTLQRVSGAVMWRDPDNGAALLQAAGLPADQIRHPRRGGRGR